MNYHITASCNVKSSHLKTNIHFLDIFFTLCSYVICCKQNIFSITLTCDIRVCKMADLVLNSHMYYKLVLLFCESIVNCLSDAAPSELISL